MGALIVLYEPVQLQHDLLNQYLDKAKVLVANSSDCVLQEIRKHVFTFMAIITSESKLPESFASQIEFSGPRIVLLGVHNMHSLLIRQLIQLMALGESSSSSLDQLFQKSLDYIDENLCESDLSLEKVAGVMFVSRCHYSRLFQKRTGTGFKNYIMNERIEKAKILLQTGRPVTEVCYSIGYNDLTHFSRVFKRKVGMNPSTYRARNLAAKENSVMAKMQCLG